MNRRYAIVCGALLSFCVSAAQEPAPKAPEFGEEYNHLSAALSIPDRADEGRWVFDVSIRNTDTKKNRSVAAADRPCGWSWELETTSGEKKTYSSQLSSRPMPGNAKLASLAPGETKTFRVSTQTSNGATPFYEVPAGTYRARLFYRVYDATSSAPPGQPMQPHKVCTPWKEFKIDAEGEGVDAPHREFPHISAGLGGKISIPAKPTGALSFDVALRNFASIPTQLYMQSLTGFSVEFRPVGDDKTVYNAVADYERPDENIAPAALARTSKPFQLAVRASLQAVRIDPKESRTFHVNVLDPFESGPLKGKWKLHKSGGTEYTDVTSLPPGRYRIRATLDPATTLDTIVSFIPLGEGIWRGMAVTNEIVADLPMKTAPAAK